MNSLKNKDWSGIRIKTMAYQARRENEQEISMSISSTTKQLIISGSRKTEDLNYLISKHFSTHFPCLQLLDADCLDANI